MLKLTLYTHRKLIFWMSLGFSIFFIWTADTPPFHTFIFYAILFMAGALITSAAFRDLHDSGTSIQYLTLPVPQYQKVLLAWFLTGPLFFLLILTTYGVGMFAHLLQHSLGMGDGMPLEFGFTFINYLTFNAIVLLGALLFKKLPLLKVLLIIFVVFALVQSAGCRQSLQNMLWWSMGLLSFAASFYIFRSRSLS